MRHYSIFSSRIPRRAHLVIYPRTFGVFGCHYLCAMSPGTRTVQQVDESFSERSGKEIRRLGSPSTSLFPRSPVTGRVWESLLTAANVTRTGCSTQRQDRDKNLRRDEDAGSYAPMAPADASCPRSGENPQHEAVPWVVYIITAARIGRGSSLLAHSARPHPYVHSSKSEGGRTRHEARRQPSPASATLDLRRRTRLSKVRRVLQTEGGAGSPSHPLHRYFRREEPPSDMGANART